MPRFTKNYPPVEGDIVHYGRYSGKALTVEWSWNTLIWATEGLQRLDRVFAYSSREEAENKSKELQSSITPKSV